MAEVVGGALLTSFLQALFDRLASEEVLGLFRRKQAIVKILDELNTVLISANKLLNDAEEKQIRDEDVKKWLDKLKDVIYQADALVDKVDSEALRRKVEGECNNRTRIKVLNKVNGFHNAVKNEATEVLHRLKVLLNQKDALGLRERVENTLTSPRLSAPLVEESSVYGRNGDKEAVVDLLLSDDNIGDKISVIPIVGMGGIGKTTLAQVVYDDERVRNRFELRAWVTVSEVFDVFKITKTLLEKVTSEKCQIEENLFELQRKLKEALRGKKFFFVLDDVWNENYNHWNNLRSSFDSAADGSKIVVTARSTTVSSVVAVGPTHRLSDLSPEDCWQLFIKHALGNISDPNAHEDLQVIGREIVKRCKGLPLAIKSIGGLLRSERNPKKWENILKSDVWDELYKKEGNILPALWLSYRHMPTHLKRCFSYCSMFPKDFEFEKEKVILLWMAEGFLRSDKQGMTMEELGVEYFEDLLSRSMFQKSTQDESVLVMHDLVHDLAMFASGGFCFRLDDNNANDLRNLATQTRHFSYGRYVFESTVFDGICKAKCLRTFIRLPLMVPHNKYRFTSHLPHNSLLTSRFLRVLCLRGSSIKKFSGSIGNLHHIRYLDLSYSKIRNLPNSLCTLYNLQTLLLSFCENLGRLPKNMKMLINLRHLDIEGVPLKKMPLQLFEMKSLQTLSKIVVGDRNRGPKINALKEVKPFCGALEISGVENISSSAEALEANLKDTQSLTCLSLRWSSKAATESNSLGRERELLDSLRPHTNLRKLRIQFYRGTIFSDWVGHDSFKNIVSIRLENCKSCCSLPPLGQLPFLKELLISGFVSVVTIGDELCGNSPSFRSLESFGIANMSKLKEWSLSEDIRDGRVFPRLADLRLDRCPALKIIIPGYLPSLVNLLVDSCPELRSNVDWVPHSKLKRFTSIKCQNLLARDYDLHRFSSLVELNISDWEGDSFPRDGSLLPTSLTDLLIEFGDSLVTLNNNAFQSLTSLEILYICNCPKLTCLPEEGLPASLTNLFIYGCPLLKKRCKKEKGEDWPKIAHIPKVFVE